MACGTTIIKAVASKLYPRDAENTKEMGSSKRTIPRRNLKRNVVPIVRPNIAIATAAYSIEPNSPLRFLTCPTKGQRPQTSGRWLQIHVFRPVCRART